MVRLLLVLLALACALTPAAAAAERPDTHAPRGADPDWLPEERWVMERWLPFEFAELERILGVDRTQAYFFLRDHGDGDRTLLDLARRRGVPTASLGYRLLLPRREALGERRWRLLRTRTTKVLTQGHLAEHMLGHVFHHWAIWRQPMRVFGVPTERLRALNHRAPSEIGAAGGLARGEVRRRVIDALTAAGRQGVRTGALPAAEAAAMRDLLLGAIDRWIDTRPDGGKRAAPAATPRAALCALA